MYNGIFFFLFIMNQLVVNVGAALILDLVDEARSAATARTVGPLTCRQKLTLRARACTVRYSGPGEWRRPASPALAGLDVQHHGRDWRFGCAGLRRAAARHARGRGSRQGRGGCRQGTAAPAAGSAAPRRHAHDAPPGAGHHLHRLHAGVLPGPDAPFHFQLPERARRLGQLDASRMWRMRADGPPRVQGSAVPARTRGSLAWGPCGPVGVWPCARRSI